VQVKPVGENSEERGSSMQFVKMAVWEFSQHFCDYPCKTRDEAKIPTEFPCTRLAMVIESVAFPGPTASVTVFAGERIGTAAQIRTSDNFDRHDFMLLPFTGIKTPWEADVNGFLLIYRVSSTDPQFPGDCAVSLRASP
jgi:hypothetical protein